MAAKADSLADRFQELAPDRQDALLGFLGLKTGIELSVPHLRLSERYKTSSTTEVHWEDGFYGRVKFVKWVKFDNLVTETWDKLQKLPRDDYFYPSMDLARVRKIVKGERLESVQKTECSSDDSKQVKTYPEAFEGENVSSVIHHVEESGNGLVIGDLHNSVQPAKNGENNDSGDIFTDEKSTTGVNSYIFMAALSLLKSLRFDENLVFRSHGFSSEIISKIHPSVAGLCYPTTVHPDQALVTLKTSHTHKVQPVCTFEFKGPGLDIVGLRGTKAPSKKDNALEVNKGECTMVGSTEIEKEAQGVSTAAKKASSHKAAKHQGGFDRMVQFFNGLFPEGLSSSDFEEWRHRKIQRALSQTLTQGLISQTGNCFLYNFEVGIAFELQEIDADGKIQVSVSRPFDCDKEQGTVAAIIAQAYYSLERLEKEKDLPFRVRELARVISTAAKSGGSGVEESHEDHQIQDTAGDTSQGRQTKIQRTEGRGDATYNERRRSGQRNLPKSEMELQNELTKTRGTRSAVSCESAGSSTCRDLVGRRSLRDEITAMFRTNEGVLGMGRSGSVLLGTWGGHKVAIKAWNFESEEGFNDLCREINFYRMLQNEYPFLLGSVIPKFFMGSNDISASCTRADVVLVTEYVGQEVRRDTENLLVVVEGSKVEKVSPANEAAIRRAALQSLEALHENQILHGDIALRNLRVHKTGDGADSLEWWAWWVDFGDARVVRDAFRPHNVSLFRSERTECALLFA